MPSTRHPAQCCEAFKGGKRRNSNSSYNVESTSEASGISKSLVKAILKEGANSLSAKGHTHLFQVRMERQRNGEREEELMALQRWK
jgi:hypothetical protein